jgi:hypothetical protein
MEKDDKLNSVSKIMFSKTVINLDLFKLNSVKELLNYINNKDVELDKVKILVRKANRELKIEGRQLFIRKSSGLDKEAENRICITKR